MNCFLIFLFCCIMHLQIGGEKINKFLYKSLFFLMRLRTSWNCSKSSCFLFNSNLFTSFSTFNCFCKSFVSRKDLIVVSNSWILFNNCSISRRFRSNSSDFVRKFVRYRSFSCVNYSIERKKKKIGNYLHIF